MSVQTFAYPRGKIDVKLFCRLLCLSVFSVDENCIIHNSGINRINIIAISFVSCYAYFVALIFLGLVSADVISLVST